MRFHVRAATLLLLVGGSTNAFVVQPPLPAATTVNAKTTSTTRLFLSDASSSSPRSGSSGGRRRSRAAKKSVSDRTPDELRSLVRDLLEISVDAGPRAAVRRTADAYRAVARTAADFLLPTTTTTTTTTSSDRTAFSAPAALRRLFERLGATYVKLGQFVASSPTLFPPEYVREFQKCLDETDPLPWRVVERVLEEELCVDGGGGRRRLSDVFSRIDRTPLASASIAQVHRATLRSTNEEVVLKVQRPGVDASLKADLGFVYASSRILEFLQPDFERTSLSAVASDLRSSMLEELDFVAESRNVKAFRDFLTEQGLDDVATAPRVYDELTTRRVLCMEFLDGVGLLDADEVEDVLRDVTGGDDTRTMESVVVAALNVWTTSVLTMPFFHADVHAGNLLLLREDGRVGFLDFGIVGKVSPSTFRAVTDMSAALANADYEGVARAMCAMGAADEEVDVVAFGEDIEGVLRSLNNVSPDVLLDVDAGTASVSVDESEMTDILLDMVRVTEDNGLRLPREFGLLVKQSLYFDRYLKILAPGLDVVGDDRVSVGGVLGAVNGDADKDDPTVVDVVV